MSENSEMHTCPHCGSRGRHRVETERKVAPVMWCMSCYQVTVLPAKPKVAVAVPQRTETAA